ncbi:MAG: hypothetical protein D8M57_06650 [Candidatus Scalindua sp. AMX11]|nr:MAG: hypothetical protein DWQ00_13745 [Candidatus Scalindua sp.]NOG85362.1 hypothetical protein [Planctomycetota bacterium]RZV83962.1 MAG: hypothetical protein EX341_08480 [Candidatus Scalindua sp. SCAELEC01]TDE65761.1 MAG: hypothetical protein D8M57_06650 [Candidatus Scalindua sp. AMX11]GJQ59634.1 MAG: hypothetical protein SCALA701_24350 [Candidatus Scalindua sp.]
MTEINGNKSVFSIPTFSVYFCKYAARIGFIITCIICIAVKSVIGTSNIKNPDGIFIALPMMFTLWCVADLLLGQYAYKICFDLNKSQVTFFMIFPLIRKKIIPVNIEDIEKITLGISVIFLFHGKKVRYSGVNNEELVRFLKELKPVTWTYLGRFFAKYHEWL